MKYKIKLKMLVNALSAQLGGGQTYLLNLFDENHREWDDFELFFLVSKSNEDVFKNKFKRHLVLSIGSIGDSFFSRTIWENFQFNKFCRSLNIDVVFLPGGTAPFIFSLEKSFFSVSQNQLPFSWDQIKKAKSLFQKSRLIILRYLQSWTFKRSKGVVFISYDAQDVVRGILNLQAPSTVVYHGINSSFFERARFRPIEDKYFLYVSTFFEYKHQLEVLRAFEKFDKALGLDLKLVFIGNLSGSYGDRVVGEARRLGIANKIVFKGNIPYAEIPSWMQFSELNIFASDCESCPNILLEYLASARPVLCSNVQPMKEFGREWVEYFSPDDVEGLTQKLLDYQSLSALDQHSVDELRNGLTWQKSALKTKKFILSQL